MWITSIEMLRYNQLNNLPDENIICVNKRHEHTEKIKTLPESELYKLLTLPYANQYDF